MIYKENKSINQSFNNFDHSHKSSTLSRGSSHSLSESGLHQVPPNSHCIYIVSNFLKPSKEADVVMHGHKANGCTLAELNKRTKRVIYGTVHE